MCAFSAAMGGTQSEAGRIWVTIEIGKSSAADVSHASDVSLKLGDTSRVERL